MIKKNDDKWSRAEEMAEGNKSMKGEGKERTGNHTLKRNTSQNHDSLWTKVKN